VTEQQFSIFRVISLFSDFLGGERLSRRDEEKRKGEMTVQEAGQKGGQKVRKLIQEGREHEEE
jgi:hypothetical protein